MIREVVEGCTTVFRVAEVPAGLLGAALGAVSMGRPEGAPGSAGEAVEIDAHFFVCAVDPAGAEAALGAVVAWCEAYPDPDRLAGGPTFVEVAEVAGDPVTAIRIFAVGEVLGLWNVITPERLGFSGTEAEEMAAKGLVMITGYQPV